MGAPFIPEATNRIPHRRFAEGFPKPPPSSSCAIDWTRFFRSFARLGRSILSDSLRIFQSLDRNSYGLVGALFGPAAMNRVPHRGGALFPPAEINRVGQCKSDGDSSRSRPSSSRTIDRTSLAESLAILDSSIFCEYCSIKPSPMRETISSQLQGRLD